MLVDASPYREEEFQPKCSSNDALIENI